MRRRQFIAGLGSAAAWPVVARAQQATMPVIGFLSAQSAEDDYKNRTVPFHQGLKEAGYVEGQNVAVEYRYAENQYDRLPALAADLVRRRVAVIATGSTPAALAAKAATTTIPIVFSTGADPVALGLVASLNRPGANVTGIANLAGELAPKQLQLLRRLIPTSVVFGILADPAFPPTPSIITDLQTAAHTLGLQIIVANARTDSDLEPAFASFSQHHVGAVLITNSPFYGARTEQLAALAARHAVTVIVAAGGAPARAAKAATPAGADQQCTGMLLDGGRKSGRDLAFGRGTESQQAHPENTGRRLQIGLLKTGGAERAAHQVCNRGDASR
jgi:putative tryptophan/tyrosine transport system substrate-binding protein